MGTGSERASTGNRGQVFGVTGCEIEDLGVAGDQGEVVQAGGGDEEAVV